MRGAYLGIYSMHESSESRVCSVSVSYTVMVHVTEWKTWVVLILVFELKYSELLKIWLAYHLFCCICVLISFCNDRVFDTGADSVADGSMKDHLEWIVLLGIS